VSVFNRNTRRVLSYDVLRQQKTGVMTFRSSPAYNGEPVTNIVRTRVDGRRGECSTLAAVRRGFVFHSSQLVRLITL